MRDRPRMQMMAQLAAVQRVRRGSAEDALGQARRRERQAQELERQALETSAAAEQDWRAFIAAPGFAPEYGQALAGRLIEADDRAQAATARLRAAADVHARRKAEWQALEAQVRSGEASLKRLGRRLRRNDEEKRLAEQADRVTFASYRP